MDPAWGGAAGPRHRRTSSPFSLWRRAARAAKYRPAHTRAPVTATADDRPGAALTAAPAAGRPPAGLDPRAGTFRLAAGNESAQVTALHRAAVQEAAQIVQQAETIRVAAELEAAELQTVITALFTELDQMSGYVRGALDGLAELAASPAEPAASSAAAPAAQPGGACP